MVASRARPPTLPTSHSVAILSFQSRVVYGHVGNSMAEFAPRRLGHDVWPIDTVSFSNHPALVEGL